jgi:hypothetical protein
MTQRIAFSLKGIVFFIFVAQFGSALGQAAVSVPAQPKVESFLRRSEFQDVLKNREVITHAKLDDRRYSFYAAMRVNRGVQYTRDILTDYRVYAKLVPYIDRADFNEAIQELSLRGGIWKFILQSKIRFEERSPTWVHYRVVSGHFRGLEGNFYFEALPEKGTLVYFEGAQEGDRWPPQFVIERGAEIVFGFTAKRMRNYVESQK